MPKAKKTIELDVLKLYMEMGGMSQEFVAEVGRKFGKSGRTLRRWEKEGDWKEKAKEPQVVAIQELEAEKKLDAQELIAGFLDMCKTGFGKIETKASYIDAIFGTAYDRIPNADNPKPKRPIVVETIEDMDRLSNMEVRLIKAKIDLAKLALLLVGEPDSRAEVNVNILDVIMERKRQAEDE